MNNVGIIWLVVLVINCIFICTSISIKTNIKIFLASLVLVALNYLSMYLFCLITGEYLEIASGFMGIVVEVAMHLPMIISIIVMSIKVTKNNNIVSTIYGDIVALNLCFIIWRYAFAMTDKVNITLLMFDYVYFVAGIFIVLLIGKWLALYVKSNRIL